MPGGIYVALSGLRHNAEQLDQIASDIANASTSGYKSERAYGSPARHATSAVATCAPPALRSTSRSRDAGCFR